MILSCKNQNSIDITGNWYTKNKNPLMIDDSGVMEFYFEEDYVTEHNIFSYSNIYGFLPPFSYKISNDSLYVDIGMKSKLLDFRGTLRKLSDTSFVIEQLNIKKDTFYRLKDTENTLDKFIVINDSLADLKQNNNQYTQAFLKRSENY